MFKNSKKRKSLRQTLAWMLSLAMILSNLTDFQVSATTVSDGDSVTSGDTVSSSDVAYDPGKIDVWDFGAEQLDTAKYNNMFSVDIINGLYSADKVVGSEDKNNTIASFECGDLSFNDGGASAAHRWRTTNTSLTRYDSKSKTGSDKATYTGYIYSNKSSTDTVYIGLNLEVGDIVTYWVGSNGNAAVYGFESPSGKVQNGEYSGTNGVEPLTFYVTEAGTHKLYCTNEKMVVARIYREHTADVNVSGSVTAPEELSDYSLLFTNTKNGMVTEAQVVGGSYSVVLKDNYSYDVALGNANGYIITSEASLSLEKGAEATKYDATVSAVALHTLSGNIVGLDEAALADAKFVLSSDEIYIPEVKVNGSAYSAELETGVEYTLSVEGINDYQFVSDVKIKIAEDTVADIELEKKPVYKVTIAPEGATVADLATATFIFTNLNEEGYVYTFTGAENIQLRDGVYSVEVKDSGAFVQQLTSNLKVEGATVTKTIKFISDITEWDFRGDDYTGQTTYNGLTITGGSKHGASYGMMIKNGSIVVPVPGECEVKVSVGYNWDISFDDGTVSYFDNTNSGDIDVSYSYTGSEGTVTINAGSQCTSYIKKIEIIEKVSYKETVTVGAEGCDYTTINDALDVVRAMERTNGERVTISIAPGNYEEMLVIDTPNVTLKNASATPSIELKNKGVDIDENAVRITHYYGHGYTYYSMGDDCKYDEEILAVNKENGYESFTNPGSGTTSGSYWNATVVVSADGFEADGIIFENSFNQYISEKAADDVLVAQSGAKEGSVPRAEMQAGDTTVQNKKYVERAAALAIANNTQKVSFDNCKFIGRQDTLYGGTGVTAAFYDCAIYGGTDYIFGGMTAVFAKCDLVFNTSEDGNDVGHITAAQTQSGRGMLMYNCHVTSTVPGVDTASEYTSKAGTFGRPWAANSGEAVFYNTVIDATDAHWYDNSASMIKPAGWDSGLSGESKMSAEYGTYEMAKDVDNQASRAAWATTLNETTGAVLADGTAISVEAFLGDWDAFAGKDMTIVMPTEKVDNKPVEDEEVSATTEFVLETSALTAFAAGAKADGDEEKAGTENYFTLIYSAKSKVDSSSKTWDDGYTSGLRVNFGGKAELEKNAVKFTTSNPATVKVWWVEGGDDNRQMTILNAAGEQVAVTTETLAKNATCISTFELAEAGTYYLGGATNNNYLFKVVVTEEKAAEPIVSTLDTATDLDTFAAGAKADGDEEKAGTEDYFTVIYSAKSKVDGSSKTWDDGYTSSQRLNLGGKVELEKNAVKFTTSNPASVKIWWVEGGDDNRQMAILNAAGEQVAVTAETLAKNATCISTLELTEAGTYYLGGATNNNYIFKVEVTETPGGAVKPPRADWSTVEAPVIVSAEQDAEEDNTIEVNVTANVGYDGADKITVSMMDEAGEVVATKNSSKEATDHTVTFNPTASGDYTFSVVAIRDGEEDKAGAETKTAAFVLKLEAPYIKSATNMGGGDVSVEWNAVAEATGYVLTVEGTDIRISTEELSATVEGLTIGQEYTIKVVAVRGEETSEAGSITVNVVDEVQRKWSFTAYGSSTNEKNNGYEGNINDGSVTVYSEGGKGKIVPASTDGLAFYYTEMNPETENFTLTATVTVDSWAFSNGQEGFGLMVSDTIGTNGDSTNFWNNSYQLLGTKIEYYYDGEAVTTDSSHSKISMKLGLGSIAKTGATAQGIADVKAGLAAMPEGFVSESATLESSAGPLGAGTYNLVGNYDSAKAPGGDLEELITTFRLQIQRNNTGYILRYLDEDDNVIGEKLYYDLERTALTQIDEDTIYLGFVASRNARITVTDVELTTIHPDDDAPAEEREIEYVYPVNTVESATFSSTADYELVYYGNADGQLTITDADGQVLLNTAFEALTKQRLDVVLEKGTNTFNVTFVPDPEYRPGEYKELTSYETVSLTHKVEYKASNRKYIFVSPEGTSSAVGSKAEPMDIYSAVKVVGPGQTIVVMEGTYELSRTVTVERGIDGTADNMIYMIADPDATTRPVFDFNGKCAGMILAGDYWYFQGFDVTESANGQKGIQVSGNNNVLDDLRAYRNGNTGIQISRFKGTDEWEDWPANNLILNCTSYLNADAGYEDADGFAAKLTIADGNVFDGCIAAYNADDGWDLFAKVQTGSIGDVVIKNSIAFKNGYDIDAETGAVINAGNGNGFKMGGDSMPGAHKLINSIAFANKAKGIDSNSGPNIQAYNCTSFDNESYNVAFYTNTAVNTAYIADGVLSYKVSNSVQEQIKEKGTQVSSDIYGVTNYYFNGSESVNTEGAKVTSDWFVNLDTAAAITGITRNADGIINMNGYLELTDAAAANAGARMTGTASAVFVITDADAVIETPEEPAEPTSAPTQAPVVTEAPTQAPVVTEAPTQAPVVTEAPTQAPVVTEAPTQAPVVTEAPTQAPVVTEAPTNAPTQAPAAPTATPSPEEVVEEAIRDIVTAGANAANNILNAGSVEELREAVSSFVSTVVNVFRNLPYINVRTARSLATAEAAIAASGASIEIDDNNADSVEVTGISNGLFTVPEGGRFEVRDTTLSRNQRSMAMRSGISERQLNNAVPFDMGLFNHNNNAVQPAVPMVVDFKLPSGFVGKDVKLLHYTGNGVEIIEVEENGNIGSAVVNGFSTFALVALDATKAPKTSDIVVPQVNMPASTTVVSADGNGSIFPWICLAVAVLAGGAAVVTGAAIFRKKDDE